MERLPTELVGTCQVKQVPRSFGVAGFPTVLAVEIFPTTSLVGRLPQKRLWDWHTIENLAIRTASMEEGSTPS